MVVSEERVDRMVEAAVKYKGKINDSAAVHGADLLFFFSAEDEAAAARIIAKNDLESYAYNFRSSLADDKL